MTIETRALPTCIKKTNYEGRDYYSLCFLCYEDDNATWRVSINYNQVDNIRPMLMKMCDMQLELGYSERMNRYNVRLSGIRLANGD